MISDIFHPMKSILLLGGGYVLSSLAAKLSTKDFLITTRNEKKLEKFKAAGYEAFLLDISNSKDIELFTKEYPNIKTVVDSVPRLPEGFKTSLDLFPKSYFTDSRIIYLGTTGVYGEKDGKEVTEDSPLNPFYEGGKIRLKREQGCAEFASCCILRLPGIYGPDRGMGKRLKAGRYKLPSNQARWANRIHVEDIALTIMKLLETDNLPAVLNVSDSEPTPVKEVVNFYCETFGFDLPEENSEASTGRSNSGRAELNQKVVNTKLLQFLGQPMLYPSFRQGAKTEFLTNKE